MSADMEQIVIRPGDKVILSSPKRVIGPKEADYIKSVWKERMPGVDMVIVSGLEVHVVHP